MQGFGQPIGRAAARGARRARAASSLASLGAPPPSALALLAPQQGISMEYGQLDLKARQLATGLEDLGYVAGSVIISDFPNTAENLLLQCALAHVGAAIATPPKDEAAMAALCAAHDVRGVVTVDGMAPTAGPAKALPTVYLELEEGLRPASRGAVAFAELLEHCPPRGGAPAATPESLVGVFGTAPLSHAAAADLGADAASTLGLSAADRVCCSVTLMHAFGVQACAAAFGAGAAVVLPAVGGIRGCGDPSQRASVTADVLATSGATVLFGDTHTLRAMAAAPAPAAMLALRTGVIKIGSGSSFLPGVREAPAPKGGEPLPLEYAGVAMHAFGKAK